MQAKISGGATILAGGLACASIVGATGIAASGYLAPGASVKWEELKEYPTPDGRIAVRTIGGGFDTKDHPFFKPMANGRACVSCHQPADAMSLSTRTIRQRWQDTGGKDPLFAAVDGSNCPNLPQERASSHSLLLERGVFRISFPWPPRRPDGTEIDPEFKIEVVSDPTGCNTSPIYGLASASHRVSVYRRPRMAANLRYIDTPMLPFNGKLFMPLERDPVTNERSSMSMMADGRATSLRAQMAEAMQSHMEVPTDLHSRMLRNVPESSIDEIVKFERNVYVAASYSAGAGDLTEPGHPRALGVDAVATGKAHVNGADLDNRVFFTFDQWRPGGANEGATPSEKEFRSSVLRGYDVFFRRAFWIGDTVGINNISLGNPYKQTCGFCHNSQLTGQDLVPGWMDLGTQNRPHALAAPDLPLFKITCKASANPHPFIGRIIYSNDPGRALVSGRCQDVGGIVMQGFRGIAARAPYFANGSAKTLREVIDFYDRRYNIGYTEREKVDLVNFLSVL